MQKAAGVGWLRTVTDRAAVRARAGARSIAEITRDEVGVRWWAPRAWLNVTVSQWGEGATQHSASETPAARKTPDLYCFSLPLQQFSNCERTHAVSTPKLCLNTHRRQCYTCVTKEMWLGRTDPVERGWRTKVDELEANCLVTFQRKSSDLQTVGASSKPIRTNELSRTKQRLYLRRLFQCVDREITVINTFTIP